MKRTITVGSTRYEVSNLTTGEVRIDEQGGSNVRWFNSKSEFSEWLSYTR